MITRLRLQNFLSHHETVIEPAAGVTFLVGPNNCGKSAIVRALETLVEPRDSAYVIRHGSSFAIVEMEDSNGLGFRHRRTLKSSTFSYRKGKMDAWDEAERGRRSETYEQRIGIRSLSDPDLNLHLGNQKLPCALIGLNARNTARLLAGGTDAEYLLKMQTLAATRENEAKREKAAAEKAIEAFTKEKARYDAIPVIAQEIELAKQIDKDLESRSTDGTELGTARQRLAKAVERWQRLSAEAKCLSSLPDPLNLQDETALREKLKSIKAVVPTIEVLKEKARLLGTLPLLPVLSPAHALEADLRKLEVVSRLERAAVAEAGSLNELPADPMLGDTAALKATLQKYQKVDGDVHQMSAVLATLSELPLEPIFTDVSVVNRSVVALRSLWKAVEDRNIEVNRCSAEIGKVEELLNSYVGRECPTCHQPLSASALGLEEATD